MAVVDAGVGDGTSVLGGVDETEVVGTGSVVLEVHREERLGKRRLDGVKESLLGSGGDSVDRAESETKETVSVLVLAELRRDGSGSLNGLGGGSDTSNGDLVSVDLASRAGTVTVADLPCVTALDLGVIDLVVVMASKLRRGLEGGEDPAVSRLIKCPSQCEACSYRSADPVSKSRLTVVVPMVTGLRYAES